jgi:hypothetical protein
LLRFGAAKGQKKGNARRFSTQDGADRILAKHKQLEPLNGMLRRAGRH